MPLPPLRGKSVSGMYVCMYICRYIDERLDIIQIALKKLSQI
jgi:hypothetical protein